MKFSLREQKTPNGAGLYIRVFELTALLPALYLLTVPNYRAIVTQRGLLSFLFDLGMSALPRLEALGLSTLYRLSGSELPVHFGLLGLALLYGILALRLLRSSEQTARAAHWAFAGLLGLDLALRLLPVAFNSAFGLIPAILGFLIRLACLILVLLDLRADRKEKPQA